MRRPIVIKFGGSVLTGEAALHAAAQETYRFLRSGHPVLVVVSAFSGRTDVLERSAPTHDAAERARWIARGEQEAAAALAEVLRARGLQHAVCEPEAIGLTARGPLDEAWPAAVDRHVLRETLETKGIVIVPGFHGVAPGGATALFGRGGSDGTALFLARELDAERCLLVKDVDGVYERDPASPGPRPRRFDRITPETAVRLAGQLIQPKALAFASGHALSFEITTWNQARTTRVGPGADELATSDPHHGPLRVALLGHGTVGAAVARRLEDISDVEVVGALVRDAERHAAASDRPQSWFTTEASTLRTRNPDLVIELLGGEEPARQLVSEALVAGIPVVTANKALLARHGAELELLAVAHGTRILGSAAVGGVLPAIELVHTRRPRALRGVLNGTTNHVLEDERVGLAPDQARARARAHGLAEADASRDLDGRDALDKLRLLVGALGEDPTSCENAIESWPGQPPSGKRWRQVASWGPEVGGTVRWEAVGPEDPFFDLPGAENALVLDDLRRPPEVVRGTGAGALPTATAVIADLLDLLRERRAASRADARAG